MKLFREPLLHFALAGGVLFLAYALLNQDRPSELSGEPIKVGDGEIRWLRETFSNQWLRAPDEGELRGLVADLVNEELLAREAQAMGLGENDTIIRRRLAQKLKFLVEDTTRLAEPTDEELRQYFEKNTARFEAGTIVTFKHVFFNPQERANATLDASAALLKLLKAGAGAWVGETGDRFLLDNELANADEQTVSSMFGANFAKSILALPTGVWSGPLKSGYGLHLAFVEKRTLASNPVFETVRDKVAKEWRREKEESVSKDYLARLREKYGVVLDESVKPLLEPQPAKAVALRR